MALQEDGLGDTATRCNTLQHAATRCNILQHAAPSVTRCNTRQHSSVVPTKRTPRVCQGLLINLRILEIPTISFQLKLYSQRICQSSLLQRERMREGLFLLHIRKDFRFGIAGMLQCAAVCCSVLQCVAVCRSVLLQHAAGSTMCCSELWSVAACCSMLQSVVTARQQATCCVAVCCRVLQRAAEFCYKLSRQHMCCRMV